MSQFPNPDDAEEFSGTSDSMPPLGMDTVNSEEPIVLKDWSAQEFANIYIRFRPHLIAHARRVLREEWQAEEVVQDAFLYLMTALPELDSELGVLKFLKWKTKMLSLDVVRMNQRRDVSALPSDEIESELSDPVDAVVRADDAAIVSLALAKLEPRHRAALLASLETQNTTSHLAQRFGVSENGYRQLLYRARRSFREALVGEVSTDGKSISEILSIAARKAAASRVSALMLVGFLVVVGSSSILNVGSTLQDEFEFASEGLPQESISQESIGSRLAEIRVTPEALSATGVEELETAAEAEIEVDQGSRVGAWLEDMPNDSANVFVPESAPMDRDAEEQEALAGRLASVRKEARTELASKIPLDAMDGELEFAASVTTEGELTFIKAAISEGFMVSAGLLGSGKGASLDFLVLSYHDPFLQQEFQIIPTNLHSEASYEGDEITSLAVWATDFLAGDTGGRFENLSFDFQFGGHAYMELIFELGKSENSSTDVIVRMLDSTDI